MESTESTTTLIESITTLIESRFDILEEYILQQNTILKTRLDSIDDRLTDLEAIIAKVVHYNDVIVSNKKDNYPDHH